MAILDVRHTTVYRYNRPVHFGDHRLMLRPRDSHDLRLIQTSLTCSPSAALTWHYDVFGNSIAVASFASPASELRIESVLQLETYVVDRPPFQITGAVSYPFIYSAIPRTIASIWVGCLNATIPILMTASVHGRAASFEAIRPIHRHCLLISTEESGVGSRTRAGTARVRRLPLKPSTVDRVRAAILRSF
jgi:transglutaminase-like putative cysteine protease